MPAFAQACLLVGIAAIGANLLTLLFYSIFFHDRLQLDLALTTIIVVIIGLPLAYYLTRQHAELRVMAERYDWAAHFDDLTGLFNRRTFFEEAGKVIARAERRKSAGTLLFVDLDRFKAINDTYGHAVGDMVLREFGDVMRTIVRSQDVAGRLGGEEFVVLLARADHDEAVEVSRRIRSALRGIPARIDLGSTPITTSIGVHVHRPGETLDEALIDADRNLYLAKQRGRDCVVDETQNLVAA